MSDSESKPSTHDAYSSIRKLSSPNEDSNWDTWAFAMRMMLRGKNLEYVIEGGFKEGFNGTTAILPDSTARADNRLVASILTSRGHEENFVVIVPHQDSAKRMWRALSTTHQNHTGGGRYMHLRSMMTTRADSDEDLAKLITTMDVLRQRLLNICNKGVVAIDNLFVLSLISALPESWTSVTAPLELQASITPSELKSVLRGHLVKLKNHEASAVTTPSTALSTFTAAKKSQNPPPSARTDCDYCKWRGHQAEDCHRKLLNNQRREIEALKLSGKGSKSSKLAKVAQVSESDSESSVDDVRTAEKVTANSSRIKFSRAAKRNSVKSSGNDLV